MVPHPQRRSPGMWDVTKILESVKKPQPQASVFYAC